MNREEAERLLQEAEQCNPGPWGDHSRTAGYIAETIAAACGDMDSEKAYVMGLLHDIGRKFGITGLRHVTDGYRYMKELGYDDIAGICLTHSFNNRNLDEYIGKKDISEEETQWLISVLQNIEYDDYDRLIQLCDALAGNGIVLDCEERMMDVRNRYGYYPQTKWDTNLKLKEYFEAKTGHNIYELLHQDTWHL
ncbi:MAG: HD domain-containing protein [Bulleidia sp.]